MKTPTFNRTVFRELVYTFSLTLVLSSTVLLFESLYRIMKMSQGVPMREVVKLIVWIQPSFLVLGIPMSLLIAVLVVYGRMTMDNETIALSALGTPFSIIARPAVGFSALCLVLALGVSLYFFPLGNRLFRETLYEAMTSHLSIDPGVINDQFPNLLLQANIKHDDRTFGELFLYNTKDPERPVVVTARRGEVYSDPQRGVFQFVLEDGDVHVNTSGTSYTYLTFGRYFMEFSLAGAGVAYGGTEMFIPELWKAATRGPEDKRQSRLTQFHKRLALPVSCLLLGYLAPGLAGFVGRAGRLGGFALALVVICGYYALLVFGESLARTGQMPAGVAVWGANVLLGIVALSVYRWKSRGP